MVPRTQTAGAALVAITMLGATFAWTFVLKDAVNALWSSAVRLTLVGRLLSGRPRRNLPAAKTSQSALA